MPPLILVNLLSSWSAVFVNTEQRQNQTMKRILEKSPYWTPGSTPFEDVPLFPEKMLPVISDVGEDCSQTPHISRGGDVRIVSSQNLGSEIADGPTNLGGAVVHGGGGLA